MEGEIIRRKRERGIPQGENPDMLGWTRGQWRQFLLIFFSLFFFANAFFWYQVVRHELSVRDVLKLFVTFDREWAYLQRLSRYQRFEALNQQPTKPDRIFRGERMGLSFSYPDVWGELEESFVSTYSVSVRLKRGAQSPLIVGYRKEPPQSYITGWDSMATGISSYEDVERICETKALGADTCFLLTSSNGVRYTRVRYDNFIEVGEAVPDAVLYVFHHPKSEYGGIVISNIELRKLGFPHTVADMDTLADSLVIFEPRKPPSS